ncbi:MULTISPECIES: hypothetical protein [unclassified Nostoc]|uniref:hypothetical protein n=1 Tax=unclassified Nostoc TaxID=2593658 RepID=UPI002AD4855B|nr:hypothetical protein [Nostoc sp. DedQUE03]MDZ7971052.1 hypothetical protein [Nostoc sp. DedQUE03]MDZ8046527.1 hypothetical protein [Nostoc sp. DedQUE02]
MRFVASRAKSDRLKNRELGRQATQRLPHLCKNWGVAELKYEFGCRDVAVLRLYKDFGIMQNPTSYMESATPKLENSFPLSNCLE